MKPVLWVDKLTKSFGSRCIIRDLSFSIAKGDRVTMFAPSGSGKTSLIHILSHLDRQFDGSFQVHATNAATIFQEPRLFAYMTVQENIFFPLRIRDVQVTPPIHSQYQSWLDVCGLTDHQQHYPYQISGGMKQKVSLIRSFITNPDFIMMDEPFKSIDMTSKNRIIRHILHHYPDTTMLLVTHNLDEIPLLTRSLLLFKQNVLADFQEYTGIADQQVSELFSYILGELNSDVSL